MMFSQHYGHMKEAVFEKGKAWQKFVQASTSQLVVYILVVYIVQLTFVKGAQLKTKMLVLLYRIRCIVW